MEWGGQTTERCNQSGRSLRCAFQKWKIPQGTLEGGGPGRQDAASLLWKIKVEAGVIAEGEEKDVECWRMTGWPAWEEKAHWEVV